MGKILQKRTSDGVPRVRRALLALLVSSALLGSGTSSAQQTVSGAASYANMQRAVGGIMKDALSARGYAPTDARTYGTLQAVGGVAAGVAGTVATGALVTATAPGWMSLMLATAVGTVVSFGVNAALNWVFAPNSSTPITRPATPTSTATGSGSPVGGGFWMSYYPNIYATDAMTSILGQAEAHWNSAGPYTVDGPSCHLPDNFDPTLGGQSMNCNGKLGSDVAGLSTTWYPKGSPCALSPGKAYKGDCTVMAPVSTTAPQAESLASAIQSLTQAQLDDRVNYAQMAQVVNELWKRSSAQNPSTTVPYDPGNPIKPSDVEGWDNKNPDKAPRVRDIATPVPVGTPGWTPDLGTASDPGVPATTNPSVQIPTDYNREVTQQQMLEQLKASDMPDGSTIDKDKDLKDSDDKNKSADDKVAGITPDAVGLFDWFPHIPTAACSNPSVLNNLGASVEVPICSYVDLFSKVISAIISVFAMIGMVREIQNAIKA